MEHRTLQKTIQVQARVWWKQHRDEVIQWMEDEDARMSSHEQNSDRPCIFLFTDEQMTWFALKWPQVEIEDSWV